jgi:hypothetical protein
MQAIIRPLTAAIFFCAGIGMAGAQTQDGTTNPTRDRSPAQNHQPQPNAAGGNATPVPQQQTRSGSSPAFGSLSEELDRSGGIIQPPPTGDRGVVQPPNQGASRTPVIPPPGTPGGNPQIQPK